MTTRMPSTALRLIATALTALVLASCGTPGTESPGPGPDAGPEADTGSLAVTVSGLPTGLAADATVSGPAGFSRTLTTTETFSELEPGTYAVAAREVTSGASAYAPVVTGSPATVQAGATAQVAVEYLYLDPAESGSLELVVIGLPDGAPAAVAVSGPGGYDAHLTASGTLDGLTPGYYTVTADDLEIGGAAYEAAVEVPDGGEAGRALVLPDAATTVTVTYHRTAIDEHDSAVKPAVHARFRAVAGAPVWLDRPLFNKTEPIDTQGLQYRNAISNPGDPDDTLQFDLVHGESPTSRVVVNLECDPAPVERSPIRAALRHANGTLIGTPVTCGESHAFSVPNTGGTGSYLLAVEPIFSDPHYTAYVLSIDAFCFQECEYRPYLTE